MAGILKLNAISPLADPIFAGYEYGDNIKDPMGIMVRSANMADYPAGENLRARVQIIYPWPNMQRRALLCSTRPAPTPTP